MVLKNSANPLQTLYEEILNNTVTTRNFANNDLPANKWYLRTLTKQSNLSSEKGGSCIYCLSNSVQTVIKLVYHGDHAPLFHHINDKLHTVYSQQKKSNKTVGNSKLYIIFCWLKFSSSLTFPKGQQEELKWFVVSGQSSNKKLSNRENKYGQMSARHLVRCYVAVAS